MNCPEFLSLDLREKISFLGELNHLAMNDSDTFLAAASMIRVAVQAGKLDGVEILPEPIHEA